MLSYRQHGKRILDLGLALPALVLASPLLAGLALAVLLTMGRPVFFRQRRPGLYGRTFTLTKLRTLREAFDDQGQPLPDHERLTSLGSFLRRTSLDELPELWQVVRGEMSMVGPRPLLVRYLPRYSDEQARRHDVLPGITGWAQVNGRNTLSWEQKLSLDTWYVDHLSLGLDLKILCLTAWTVLRRDGISAEGHATMPEFMGNGPSESTDGGGKPPAGAGQGPTQPSAQSS